VASTPAPQWLGEPTAPERPASPRLLPAPAEVRLAVEGERLQLRRVQVSTEGFSAVAEVLVARGDVVHAGVADAASTPAGTLRALAEAAGRCLESAGGGRLRVEVDGVQVEVVAGRPTAVVALSVVTSRGHERLSGAALADGDVHQAVVHAVLAASNRRLALALVDHEGSGG